MYNKVVRRLFYHIDKECSRFIIFQNINREVYDKEKHVNLFIFITTSSLFHPPIFFYVNWTLLEGVLQFCQSVRKE